MFYLSIFKVDWLVGCSFVRGGVGDDCVCMYVCMYADYIFFWRRD